MVFYPEGEVFLFPFPFPSCIFFPAHAPSCPSAPVLQLFVRACITPRGPGLTVSYYSAPWLCFAYHHSANHYRIIHVEWWVCIWWWFLSFGFYALFGIVLFFLANNEFVDLSKSVGTDAVRLCVGQIGLGDSKNPASRHPSTVPPRESVCSIMWTLVISLNWTDPTSAEVGVKKNSIAIVARDDISICVY